MYVGDIKSYVMADAINLMTISNWHKSYKPNDVSRYICTPIMNDRAMWYFDDEEGTLQGFLTWAFLDKDAEEAYLNKSRPLEWEDWNRLEGNLWIIDMIAPYGNVLEMVRQSKKWFEDTFGETHSVAYFKRNSKRIGHIKRKFVYH
jgi:hemolysin-activating ACP:hemolysin acyltransferase